MDKYLNKIILGDCLEVMKDIPNKSIDMILCDLPYGTTACKWDTIIPFEPLWEQYKRIIKDNGAIVLTAQEPFSSMLRISEIKLYRYDWYWMKTKYSNFLCLKKQPAKNVENICIFYKKQPLYNPQMLEGKPYKDKGRKQSLNNQQKIGVKSYTPIVNEGKRFPNSTILFSNGNNKNVHPTQKPVALFEYLIKTYTNEGDLVLDNCIGSGTTAVACRNLNRNFIGIEKDAEYCKIANQRLAQEVLL
jgi:site-specific DNA-methyltransferase (adenine-specific)